jgi:hypothetical protein
MSCIRSLALCLAVALPGAAADDKKGEKKESPRITASVPFAIVPGTTNQIKIRGLNLTNATELRFPGAQSLKAEIKSRGKATVPDKADPKKLGDTQLEVELVLPTDFIAGDLPFFVSTPDGDTNTNQFRVIERRLLFDEKEPNGGFRKPNDVQLPQSVRGVIGEANDVDVFRFAGKAGQKIRVESLSGPYGSTLDPVVTLHHARGHALATSDDASASVDGSIQFTLPRDGQYCVSVIDAHDRGGGTYGYVLVLRGD